MNRARGRIHGRTAELDIVRKALDDARTGHGRTVLVEGEAGIGKTRLLEETLDDARSSGMRVFYGAALELERGRPFGAVIDAFAIRPDAEDEGLRGIAHVLGGHTAAPDAPLLTVPELRFQIADAIIDFLESAAEAGPAIVAVDDLHWTDAGTLGVFRSAVRRLAHLPVLVVLAFRPTTEHTELDRLVDELTREGAIHLGLATLDSDAVEQIVAEGLGAPPGPSLRAQLGTTGGNPLYVLELIRALEAEGAIERTGGTAEAHASAIPSDIRLMLIRQISTLPPDTLELLRLAAVLGSTFSVRDLSILAGRSAASLLGPLQAALRTGILGERGERLGFRHELVRVAVYTDMPEAVRRALHLEAGRLLSGAGAAAEQVATHMSLGAESGDMEAVAWLRRAAREAAPRSILVSVDLLERALELVPAPGRERDAVGAELLVRLVHGGRSQEAEAVARDLLDRGTSSEELVREALAVSLSQQNRADEAREQWGEIARAATDDARRAMALADMSQASMQMVDLDSAERLARESLAIGEGLDDPSPVCASLMTLSLVASCRADVAEATELGRRAVAMADAVRARGEAFPVAELSYAMALLGADRLDEAETSFVEGRRTSEALGLASQVPSHHWGLAGRHFFAGRWDDAIAEAEAGIELVEETGYRAGLVIPYALLARIYLSRGDLEAAERMAAAGEAELLASGPAVGIDFLFWARALLHEAHGSTDAAFAVLGAAWQIAAPMRYMLSYRSLGPDLVRLAVARDDLATARAVSEEMEHGSRKSGSATANGAALLCRGLVDDDSEMLTRAVAAYREGPRPHERALAAEAAGAMLARSGRTDAALEMLDEALAAYRELGAERDVGRAEAAQRALGRRTGRRGPRKQATVGWEALTKTETEVVRLVVEGLTSPQIGARMFISPRTVQTHLAHIFRKVGCSTRVELAAEAARRQSGTAGDGSMS